MKTTERQRIEKDAETYKSKFLTKCAQQAAFTGYTKGALAEHDKARNQAIQDCIDIVSVTPGDENVIPKLESLKTINGNTINYSNFSNSSRII